MTKLLSLAVGLLAMLGLTTAQAAEWRPASGPLMTKWAKEVSPYKALPEYPRPQLVRKNWQSLNGLWQLGFAKEGEEVPTGKPLSEQILVPFPVESALSGVMKHASRLWYRRTFVFPKEWLDQRILLNFGAVDWEATVYLNGTKLGTHRGGYDSFSFDITDALERGKEQEVIVEVWDPTDAGTQPRGKQVNKPEGIFYTPTTGIWQTVWLEPVPKTAIDTVKIVADVDNSKVLVTVQGRGPTDGMAVRAVAKDGERVLSSGTGTVGKTFSIALANPRLWTPDNPFLYDLRVELRQGDKVIDAADSYFGMRKIEIGKDDAGITRILLNGKFVFQVGPLDQGFWPDGLYTAPTDEALKYDIEVTKKLGFNMTRKHVKVEPERWYYWCDKLGLLVWQDMPSGDKSIGVNDPDLKRTPESAKQYEAELKRLIDGRHNHPSIVMWVVFNEGWGQFDTKRITEWTKDYDPTRLVNCASGWADRKVGDVHDIHNYAPPASPEPEPRRAAVLGEFGGLGLPTEGHLWVKNKKNWGYEVMKSPVELTRKYERFLAQVWSFKDKPGLSAAVYTQITDVETEVNGLLTYDRAVIKVDLERAAAVNRGDVSRTPQIKVLVPTSQDKGLKWRFTLEEPDRKWTKPDFDDSKWREGSAGFGTRGTPGAYVRTEWKTKDIWLRREIALPEGTLINPRLLVHHDDDARVYLNGVLAANLKGYTTDYEEFEISDEARATLKPGKNTIAVYCKQIEGGQYIDAGLIEVK
ncbi:MAG: sugar-binding domain-containing protein [Gemmataceae bacterium]